ncbi:hypothetical protein CONCODRAFT_20332 [Conidiobolus coronatus NRRL 28638]|uniref:Uncharacterized protein n=1 Tax=Conidiobolus coronatus (strain ATCC 28846 / CBS 209.66 / NRRL 28638) TaxID=796925 RepID=A0A137NU30_CONC2|nr:hypothetical protein CONCODRAFT_20332 [Conidiobolus coronatus NRRL 28638]|eukprot:KXN66252.1 hypothetical protein CONCODRAFT_20332 [Conidiobolus coronatus NRRL 28638]
MVAKAAIQRGVRLAAKKHHPELTTLMVIVGSGLVGATYAMIHKLSTDPHLRLKRQNGHPKE